MSKLLFKKDYLAAIETCQYSWSTIGIRNFVDDLLKEYSPYNQDIISTLMEYTLSVFPTLDKQKGLENLYKKNYSNISEDLAGRKQPQLQTLYSYLIFLAENEITIHAAKNEGKSSTGIEQEKSLPSNHDVAAPTEDSISFQSDLSNSQLSAICQMMISHELIAPIMTSDFISIFRGVPLTDLKKKVRWKATYQKDKSDNVLLFFILSNIIDPSVLHSSNSLSKLQLLFSLPNSIRTLSKTRNKEEWAHPKKRRVILEIQKALKASLAQ